MNAKSSLCTVSQDEINWVRQNSIFIAQRDRNTIIQNSIKEGLEKGLEQGYKNKAIEVAKNLISMQLGTFEQIAAVAGLSVEEVRSLAENS